MDDDLPPDANALVARPAAHTTALTIRGAQADAAAQDIMLTEYRQRQSANTRRRHDTDLKVFADFLATVGVVVPIDDHEVPLLAYDATAWIGVTAGLITAYRTWMLQQGYAIGSINVRLATVRTYARLAHLADAIPADAYSRIRAVTGYRRGEGEHLDQQRTSADQATRVSTKKASAHVLSPAQLADLKQAARQLPTARSAAVHARDTLIVCLLADLGLRCGEVAILTWQSVHAGLLTVKRPKVKTVQRHRLLGDVPQALAAYQTIVGAPDDLARPLLAAFDRHGILTGFGLSERAIHKRIQQLGVLIGLPNLSPHDLRHSWATRLAHMQVPIQDLRDAGGWTTFTTPARYVAQQAIANERIVLGQDLDPDDELSR